jgi:hypothetical protein
MSYHQLTPGERYALSAVRRQGLSQAEIARALRSHPSTISREVNRNSRGNSYRPSKADQMTRGRRSRSRRNLRIGQSSWRLVTSLLERRWSPEQIAGRLPARRSAADQPRDDLPLDLGRPPARRRALQTPSRSAEAAPKTLRSLRQPRASGGQSPHQ